mgnify:CR=1 FL=1
MKENNNFKKYLIKMSNSEIVLKIWIAHQTKTISGLP